jgi:two-component system KDP operon response regulator KdpE
MQKQSSVAQSRITILIVEDDPGICQILSTTLSVEGYRIVVATSAQRAVIDASTHKPDLLIVDLGLPDADGVTVIRHVRQWSGVPILVLSARAEESDKILALDQGADDYVTKPFGVGELLARVRAALRHVVRATGSPGIIHFGAVELNLVARTTTRDGVDVHLTPIEYRLLAYLAAHAGMVVTHRQLLAEVWGPTHINDTHYLRIYVKQLRDKLEKDPMRPKHLVTETGIGYRLLVPSNS